MLIDKNKHESHLVNILVKLYKDPYIASVLGFKGDTACMFFYDLPRFSVDLDFNVLVKPNMKFQGNKEDVASLYNKVTQILLNSKEYEIKDSQNKANTLFWLVSYDKQAHNIKLEISKRDYSDSYDLKTLRGASIQVMQIGNMIARKLVAISDRKSLANRDIFDAHYFMTTPYFSTINYKIIKTRTGQFPYEFYQSLNTFLEDSSNKFSLQGLGELLNPDDKKLVKNGEMLSSFKSIVSETMEKYPQNIEYISCIRVNKTYGDFCNFELKYRVSNDKKDQEIIITIPISRSVLSIYNIQPDKLNILLNNQITDFVKLNRIGSYTVKTINTYDISKKSLSGPIFKDGFELTTY